MVVRIATVAFEGIEARPVDVQVQIAPGNVVFTVVGLGDKAVAESRERVRSALIASGLALPAKRITVNLAPADLPKEGSHYDLPIALGVMAAIGAIPADMLSSYLVLGELALDGTITSVAGVLPAAIAANSQGLGLICPKNCGPEAAWASETLDVLAPASLIQLANHFKGTQVLARPRPAIFPASGRMPDLGDIKGQESAKRALEIAAAGGHNILFNGPPGSGKSMLAACLPSILPPMTPAELLEVSLVHSIAGALAKLPALPNWLEGLRVPLLHLPSFAEALNAVHHPGSPKDIEPDSPARVRLALDELLAHQIALALMRQRLRIRVGRPQISTHRVAHQIEAALPFALTAAQQTALAEIRADLAAPIRMLRLLQGDVGSGKTLVAFLAMADVVEGGRQAALMAPTEILARQHFAGLQPRAEAAGMIMALLTGRDKAAERARTLEGLRNGAIQIVVGTHALIQDHVAFRDLGLVVVDEQHRFGVHQRLALSGRPSAREAARCDAEASSYRLPVRANLRESAKHETGFRASPRSCPLPDHRRRDGRV